MVAKVGRNINIQDTVVTTTVTVNAATATTLLAANPDRLWAKVCVDAGGGFVEVFIRDYAAATDNIKKGEIISRTNGKIYTVYKTVTDNIYTGEISAISVAGGFDVHVMEG